MAVTDVSVLKKKRKNKKLMKLTMKMLAFIIVGVIILVVINTYNIWYPKLDGILSKIPQMASETTENSDDFPITFSGGTSYQLDTMGDNIAIIDDSHYHLHSKSGKEILSVQHAYNAPTLTVSENKSLIYDLGGKGFSLISKYNQVYEINTDFPILLARLSGNDYAVVVTKHDHFTSYLMIYDKNGNNIFNYGSVQHIIDVTFNLENDGCYITTLDSVGGVIVTKILYYKFGDIDYDIKSNPIPIWETENIETMPIETSLIGDDKIILFGDKAVAYYDTTGKMLYSYDYAYDLVGYSCGENLAVLIFNNNEIRSSNLLMIDTFTGLSNTKTLDFSSENAQIYENMIYIHNKDRIHIYSSDGKDLGELNFDSKYNDFRILDDFIYLLGYDKIDQSSLK